MASVQFKILFLMTVQHLAPEIITSTYLTADFFLGAHLRIWYFIKHGKGPKLEFWCCNLTWYFYPIISLGVSFSIHFLPLLSEITFLRIWGIWLRIRGCPLRHCPCMCSKFSVFQLFCDLLCKTLTQNEVLKTSDRQIASQLVMTVWSHQL